MIQNTKTQMQGGSQITPAKLLKTKSIDLPLSKFATEFISGTDSNTAL